MYNNNNNKLNRDIIESAIPVFNFMNCLNSSIKTVIIVDIKGNVCIETVRNPIYDEAYAYFQKHIWDDCNYYEYDMYDMYEMSEIELNYYLNKYK